ncbi:MotA/TolQ/ExbB proton channel family protein [Gammaproteobacteria bacterium]|nr:MotA/TolQ/ExbB proton channel family protein [Gammaproteobacteria bacterium]|tara:strand:+ start:287 stop:943 length:657 start_codon:yes stop_codon:yes gene_type:complete
MKNFINKNNTTLFLVISFFISIFIIQIFYLAVINPLAFEYMSYAKLNNASPERHFSVILKDPEQKICLILFLWSLMVGFFNYYILQLEAMALEQNLNPMSIISDANADQLNESPDLYKILIENKFDMLQLDLTFLKYISWAIPSIGFIGTVRGIGEALSKAAEAIDGNITGMTSSLGVAFNSTFVALLISIMLMLFITRIEYKQDSLIVSLRTKFLIK